jgi:hypothetical protein
VLQRHLLSDLNIDDERAVSRVLLYPMLKQVLIDDEVTFRVLPASGKGAAAAWQQALLLNLVHWSDGGGDVLVSPRIPADVVCHVAWHHLASRALAPKQQRQTARAMFLAESVASAFDVYLVGQLLQQGVVLPAGLAAHVDEMTIAWGNQRTATRALNAMANDPGAAFSSLQQLLYGVSVALFEAHSADAAHDALQSWSSHPWSSLLHHYALSTWVLYARAHGGKDAAMDRRVVAVDQQLQQPNRLEWLSSQWL